MARTRTKIGQHGVITVSGYVEDEQGRRTKAPQGRKPTVWRARTKFRDSDGVTRDVETWGPTKAATQQRLRDKIAERRSPSSSDGLRRDMTVAEAATVWLALNDSKGRLSDNTRNQYREGVERHVKGSSVANLTLSEVNSVPVLERWLQEVADARGLGSAKTARSVMSGILSTAVRHDSGMQGNRMRDSDPPVLGKAHEGTRDTRRALSADELRQVLSAVSTDSTAEAYDVVDLIRFLAGTGARISEALAVRWEDLDLDTGVVHIEGTKTRGSNRWVVMTPWLIEALLNRRNDQRRGEQGETRLTQPVGLVFPTPNTHPVILASGGVVPGSTWGGRKVSPDQPRDRRAVTRALRKVLDDAGFPWATAHTFRKTVGDLVTKGAGVTEAANMLGHARPSMTLDHYSDRRQPTALGAAALAQFGG